MPAKLSIDLVPETCWYSNVRSNVPVSTWDRLRRKCYELAGHRCEICGGVGKRHPVECHELFEYDDIFYVQKLVRLIAVCPMCHSCYHMGRTEMMGGLERAIKHLATVNGWTIDGTIAYAAICFDIWIKRSQHKWTLDISYLEEYDTPFSFRGISGHQLEVYLSELPYAVIDYHDKEDVQ